MKKQRILLFGNYQYNADSNEINILTASMRILVNATNSRINKT